jgi:hypothetical protein
MAGLSTAIGLAYRRHLPSILITLTLLAALYWLAASPPWATSASLSSAAGHRVVGGR